MGARLFIIGLVALALVGCGGSGGGAEEAATTQPTTTERHSEAWEKGYAYGKRHEAEQEGLGGPSAIVILLEGCVDTAEMSWGDLEGEENYEEKQQFLSGCLGYLQDLLEGRT